MESPELGRYVLLHTALLHELMNAVNLDRSRDPGLASLLQELDALTMRLAHRYRAAAGYHVTPRGKAALEQAEQMATRDPDSPAWVEIVEERWSQEQAAGPIFPNAVKEGRSVTRVNPSGVKFLSEELKD